MKSKYLEYRKKCIGLGLTPHSFVEWINAK